MSCYNKACRHAGSEFAASKMQKERCKHEGQCTPLEFLFQKQRHGTLPVS